MGQPALKQSYCTLLNLIIFNPDWMPLGTLEHIVVFFRHAVKTKFSTLKESQKSWA